jgi:hypothetical protein
MTEQDSEKAGWRRVLTRTYLEGNLTVKKVLQIAAAYDRLKLRYQEGLNCYFVDRSLVSFILNGDEIDREHNPTTPFRTMCSDDYDLCRARSQSDKEPWCLTDSEKIIVSRFSKLSARMDFGERRIGPCFSQGEIRWSEIELMDTVLLSEPAAINECMEVLISTIIDLTQKLPESTLEAINPDSGGYFEDCDPVLMVPEDRNPHPLGVLMHLSETLQSQIVAEDAYIPLCRELTEQDHYVNSLITRNSKCSWMQNSYRNVGRGTRNVYPNINVKEHVQICEGRSDRHVVSTKRRTNKSTFAGSYMGSNASMTVKDLPSRHWPNHSNWFRDGGKCRHRLSDMSISQRLQFIKKVFRREFWDDFISDGITTSHDNTRLVIIKLVGQLSVVAFMATHQNTILRSARPPVAFTTNGTHHPFVTRRMQFLTKHWNDDSWAANSGDSFVKFRDGSILPISNHKTYRDTHRRMLGERVLGLLPHHFDVMWLTSAFCCSDGHGIGYCGEYDEQAKIIYASDQFELWHYTTSGRQPLAFTPLSLHCSNQALDTMFVVMLISIRTMDTLDAPPEIWALILSMTPFITTYDQLGYESTNLLNFIMKTPFRGSIEHSDPFSYL